MSVRYFLDTNVLVYAFDQSSPAKARVARELIRSAIAESRGVISYQVAQEFLNVALKKFAKPMSVAEADQVLITMLKPMLSVNSSAMLLAEALRLAGKHKLSWYDALVVAAAVEAGADILYSEDLQHGMRIGALNVENPFR